jgi:tetratricopeptide (TPR) repeat protein
MNKKILLSFLFSFSLSYAEEVYKLIVIPQKDYKTTVESLKNYGFNKCFLDNKKIICAESKDSAYIQRLKDYLSQYGFNVKIEIGKTSVSQNENLTPTQNEALNVQTKEIKVEQEVKPLSSSNQVKQIKNQQEKTVSKENSQKQSSINTPVKIQIKESKVDQELKNKQTKEESYKQEEKIQSAEKDLGLKVKLMYDFLNADNLEKAKELANQLLKTKFSKDAKYVIGLIAIKEKKFNTACRIFESLKFKNSKELEKDACSVAFMQEGYDYLEKNPNKAIEFFQKSLRYKDNIESQVGLFYAYLKTDKSKAEKIIKELYSKYPENESVKKAYVQYLLDKGDFASLEKFKKYLKEEDLKLIKESQLSKEMENALRLIKSGNYSEAENILLKLYEEKPSNINVLLLLGYLYLEKNDILKAKNFYENALMIDGNNTDALKGLKAVYVKLEDYEKALEIIKKLQQKDIKDPDYNKIYALYLSNKAQEHLKEGNIRLAKELADEILSLDKNNPTAYLILAEYYKQTGDKKEYFKNISKAYELKPDDFGIKLAFIYGLINLDFYDQAKNIIKTVATKNLSEEEKQQLKEVYKVFYQKLSAYYLSNKDYLNAKKVAQEGLMFFKNDPDLMEVLGWSCYNLKEYKCSEDTFKYLIALKPSEKNKVGLAFTYMNLKKYEELNKLLKELEDSNDPEVLKEVATIYASIGKYKEAKNVINKYEILKNSAVSTQAKVTASEPLQTLKESETKKTIKKDTILPDILDANNDNTYNDLNIDKEKKTEILTNNNYTASLIINTIINKTESPSIDHERKEERLKEETEEIKKIISEKEQDYLTNLSTGFKYRNKSGESGKSKLSDFSPFVKFTYFFNEKLYAYIGTYFTRLNSGGLSDYAHYGSVGNGTILREVPSSYSGLEPFAGFGLNTDRFILSGNFGLTPRVDNGISSKPIWTIEGKIVNNDKKIGLGLYRTPIRDSILSYVGSIDPYSYNSWGRVYEEGIKVSYENKIGEKDSLIYSEARFGKIKGEFTEENTDTNVLLMPKVYYGKLIGDEDYIGAFFLYNHFSKRQDCYYFGCGGYFSPKSLLIAAPMLEGFKFFDDRNGIHYKVFLGPLLWSDGQKNNTDISLDGYISYVYLFNKNLTFNIAGEYRKTQKYNELFFTAFIKYFFGNRISITKQDFLNLEKEIYKW